MEDREQRATDEDLLEDFVRNGHQEPFNVLVQRYKVELFNVAFRVLYDEHAARDAVQGVFIILLERRDKLIQVQSLRSWLYRTALNVSLNMKKVTRRREDREKVGTVSPAPETPREAAVRTELRQELDAALAKLKDSMRIPLILRYLQGLSSGEAGEVMNVSADAVRMRVSRALKRLRKLLHRQGLLISIVAVEEGLRSLPAKAVPLGFLPSASSVIKAASTAGIAAKAALTATSVTKGGLIMTAKAKIAIGVGAAILAGGTATYLFKKGPKWGHGPPPDKGRTAFPQEEISGEGAAAKTAVTPESAQRDLGIFGQVVGADENGMPGVMVEAGLFEGASPASLSRKVSVRSTTTDSHGKFRFPEREWFSHVKEIRSSSEPPLKDPSKRLQSLLVASKEGYFAARQPIDFDSVRGPQRIVLKKAPEVSGRVIWKETGEPIWKVRVVCTPEKSDLYQSSKAEVRTGEGGNFSLTISAQGSATIWPQFDNYYGRDTQEKKIALLPGKDITDLTLAVKLWANTVIEGRVLDAEGGSVVGARVQLSTDKRCGGHAPAISGQEGRYRLMVGSTWPYQSYFIEVWPEKPDIFDGLVDGLGKHVQPAGEYREILPDGYVDWAKLWTPPPHAPPERLVAFHPDYEIRIVEVPRLGVGQMRRGVDIVLHKGSRISGKVVDDSSERLKGAKIEIKFDPKESPVLIGNDKYIIRKEEVKSAEDGSFAICFLRAGNYELTASHDDCNPLTKRLELSPHQAVQGFDFVLRKRTGFIRGKVVDQNGNPWPHGKVQTATGYLFRGKAYVAEVKEDGSYELTHMRPGKYDLWLEVSPDYPEPEGILWATALRGVPTGTDGANITVMEFLAGTLRARVVDQATEPIQEFHFQCSPLSLAQGKSGIVTGPVREYKYSYHYRKYNRDRKYSGLLHCKRDVVSESGEFVAERVAPGSYFVSVKTDKHGESFDEVRIEPGGETEVTFELRGLGRLGGIVVDGQGRPLQGISIRARKIRGVLPAWQGVDVFNDPGEHMSWPGLPKTGADGRFVLENLEQTEYRISAVKEYRSAYPNWEGRIVSANVTVGESGQEFVRFVLQDGSGTVQGYVFGEDGSHRSKASVSLEGAGQSFVTLTDEGGHYAFRDLLPGTYLLKERTGRRGGSRGREIEVGEGEHVPVDILSWGQGEVEGKISLAGDAARVRAWTTIRGSGIQSGMRLVLRTVSESGAPGGREIGLPVGDSFQFTNIPAGTYEVRAYLTDRINPEPTPTVIESSFLSRGCRALFASQPTIVRVSPGSRAAINLTISQPLLPYYPIPDPTTCETMAPVASFGDWWTDEE